MNKKNVIIGVVVIATIALVVYYFKYKKPKSDAQQNVAPPSVPSTPLAYGIPTSTTTRSIPVGTYTSQQSRDLGGGKPKPTVAQTVSPVIASTVSLTNQTKTR
jgi:hypothetical protein